MAGVSRMRAAMPRAGETHSSLHAQHAGSSRVRAPQRSRGEAASAPRLGTPPSRYDHDLGGMDTARHSSTSWHQPSGERRTFVAIGGDEVLANLNASSPTTKKSERYSRVQKLQTRAQKIV